MRLEIYQNMQTDVHTNYVIDRRTDEEEFALYKRFIYVETRVSDPHFFFADPDPGKNLHADPDPGGIRGRGWG